MGIFSFVKKNKQSITKTDTKLPKHIAFIMDGNGRWAKKRGLSRTVGHSQGAKVFRNIVSGCFELGIDIVTVYAFSTENWKRPVDEVNAIIKLLEQYMTERLSENDSRYKLRFIGDESVFDNDIRLKMQKIEALNPNSDKTLFVGLNYGGRAEICHAVNELISEGKKSVTQEDISAKVYTGGYPEPDLIVRTGGDVRISNFLLWQCAYSELWFTSTLWPDMTIKEVKNIISSYGQKERRFGGLGSSK